MVFWIGLILLLLPTIIGAYFLFRDSMNLWQMIWPVYWVTRDTADNWDFRVRRAWARSGGEEYWQGRGIEFRWKWKGEYRSTQIGIVTHLRKKQVKWYDYQPKEIREWQRPETGHGSA